MKYLNLGRSGLKVSELCLGCMSYGKGQMHSSWSLNEEESFPFFRRAIEHGINFFDTADVYAEGASEVVVGKALREFARRDEVVIATKFYPPTGPGPNQRGASRKHIVAAVDASLKRLGVDYIDLYQQHAWDATTPLEETLWALDDLVRAGKVLYVGGSNFNAAQLRQALELQATNRWTRFISMQVQYNLIWREDERELIPLCEAEGVGVTAWSALARGFLAGNRTADGKGATTRAKNDPMASSLYFRDNDFAVQATLAEVAAERGAPPMQIALAWIASRPGLTAPIIGATKLEQLDQAVAATEVTLTDDEVRRLEKDYAPRLPSAG